MPGIGNLTISQLRQRILSFDRSYLDDWNAWLDVRRNQPGNIAREFGRVLRRWQACRPNRMRRSRMDANYKGPYLDDLLSQSHEALAHFDGFKLHDADVIDQEIERTLTQLWKIFQYLSFSGRARNGFAGVVGISKAVLLLTEGRIGPAFDSEVRRKLRTGNILTPEAWAANLRNVATDIAEFERSNQCVLCEAVPKKFAHLHYGRLYDMILGPGTPELR